MSQVFRFSGSYLLLITTVLVIGLSLEIGTCQDLDDWSEFTSDEGVDGIEVSSDSDPSDQLEQFTNVNSQDFQTILASSNGPLGLWSGLKTDFIPAEDGTLLKSRKAGLFTYGSDLLKIDQYSWMSLEDENGYMYDKEAFAQTNTLKGAKYPFVMYREDLTSISHNPSLVNPDITPILDETDATPFIEETTSKTYILLDYNYYDLYNISDLDAAFANTDVYEKFSYNPEMSKLSSQLGVDLSIFFPPDLWALFAEMFHDFAVEQLNRKNQQSNEDTQDYIDNMFNKCDGGVCCDWGTS